MVFSSILFLAYFLPAFLLVYFAIPRRSAGGQRLRNGWLLLGSLVFYAWGAPQFTGVLLVSTVLDFGLVRRMAACNEQAPRRRWLIASLVLNLGLLAVFKYTNFLLDNLAASWESATDAPWPWPLPNIALPIGISFYTFQTLTYALDVYRKETPPLDRLSDYLVYILSFPQMIAGPIVRFGQIAHELRHRAETLSDRLAGAHRFTIGLGKKVLLANPLAEQANLGFDGPLAALSPEMAWISLLAYAFQIYFDFSGYSDMAIGLGRMMGFHFPENFRSPYTSRSITEFWRRWHITLGDFMRDYLYIPLGGNRLGRFRTHANLVAVFLLSGLWHGASWNFVAWGAFHGAFLVLDRVFLRRVMEALPRGIAVGFTFFVTLLGWVVFRLDDGAASFYRALFGGGGMWCEWMPGAAGYLAVAAAFSGLTLTRWGRIWEERAFEGSTRNARSSWAWSVASVVLFAASLSALVSADLNPFIYFRF